MARWAGDEDGGASADQTLADNQDTNDQSRYFSDSQSQDAEPTYQDSQSEPAAVVEEPSAPRHGGAVQDDVYDPGPQVVYDEPAPEEAPPPPRHGGHVQDDTTTIDEPPPLPPPPVYDEPPEPKKHGGAFYDDGTDPLPLPPPPPSVDANPDWSDSQFLPPPPPTGQDAAMRDLQQSEQTGYGGNVGDNYLPPPPPPSVFSDTQQGGGQSWSDNQPLPPPPPGLNPDDAYTTITPQEAARQEQATLNSSFLGQAAGMAKGAVSRDISQFQTGLDRDANQLEGNQDINYPKTADMVAQMGQGIRNLAPWNDTVGPTEDRRVSDAYSAWLQSHPGDYEGARRAADQQLGLVERFAKDVLANPYTLMGPASGASEFAAAANDAAMTTQDPASAIGGHFAGQFLGDAVRSAPRFVRGARQALEDGADRFMPPPPLELAPALAETRWQTDANGNRLGRGGWVSQDASVPRGRIQPGAPRQAGPSIPAEPDLAGDGAATFVDPNAPPAAPVHTNPEYFNETPAAPATDNPVLPPEVTAHEPSVAAQPDAPAPSVAEPPAPANVPAQYPIVPSQPGTLAPTYALDGTIEPPPPPTFGRMRGQTIDGVAVDTATGESLGGPPPPPGPPWAYGHANEFDDQSHFTRPIVRNPFARPTPKQLTQSGLIGLGLAGTTAGLNSGWIPQFTTQETQRRLGFTPDRTSLVEDAWAHNPLKMFIPGLGSQALTDAANRQAQALGLYNPDGTPNQQMIDQSKQLNQLAQIAANAKDPNQASALTHLQTLLKDPRMQAVAALSPFSNFGTPTTVDAFSKAQQTAAAPSPTVPAPSAGGNVGDNYSPGTASVAAPVAGQQQLTGVYKFVPFAKAGTYFNEKTQKQEDAYYGSTASAPIRFASDFPGASGPVAGATETSDLKPFLQNAYAGTRFNPGTGKPESVYYGATANDLYWKSGGRVDGTQATAPAGTQPAVNPNSDLKPFVKDGFAGTRYNEQTGQYDTLFYGATANDLHVRPPKGAATGGGSSSGGGTGSDLKPFVPGGFAGTRWNDKTGQQESVYYGKTKNELHWAVPKGSGTGSASGGGSGKASGGATSTAYPFTPGGYAGKRNVNGVLENMYYGTTAKDPIVPGSHLKSGTTSSGSGKASGGSSATPRSSGPTFEPGHYAGRAINPQTGQLENYYFGQTSKDHTVWESEAKGTATPKAQPQSGTPAVPSNFVPGGYAGTMVNLKTGQLEHQFFGATPDQRLWESDLQKYTAPKTPQAGVAATPASEHIPTMYDPPKPGGSAARNFPDGWAQWDGSKWVNEKTGQPPAGSTSPDGSGLTETGQPTQSGVQGVYPGRAGGAPRFTYKPKAPLNGRLGYTPRYTGGYTNGGLPHHQGKPNSSGLNMGNYPAGYSPINAAGPNSGSGGGYYPSNGGYWSNIAPADRNALSAYFAGVGNRDQAEQIAARYGMNLEMAHMQFVQTPRWRAMPTSPERERY